MDYSNMGNSPEVDFKSVTNKRKPTGIRPGRELAIGLLIMECTQAGRETCLGEGLGLTKQRTETLLSTELLLAGLPIVALGRAVVRGGVSPGGGAMAGHGVAWGGLVAWRRGPSALVGGRVAPPGPGARP